jgi:hypothetical protein
MGVASRIGISCGSSLGDDPTTFRLGLFVMRTLFRLMSRARQTGRKESRLLSLQNGDIHRPLPGSRDRLRAAPSRGVDHATIKIPSRFHSWSAYLAAANDPPWSVNLWSSAPVTHVPLAEPWARAQFQHSTHTSQGCLLGDLWDYGGGGNVEPTLGDGYPNSEVQDPRN